MTSLIEIINQKVDAPMTRLLQIVSGMLISLVLVANAQAAEADRDAAIAERLKPVGENCMEGDSTCAGAGGGAGGAAARPGSEVYTASCAMCHASGLAGAPKFGDAAMWADRIAKGKDTLYQHAIHGFNGMPTKGACMSCSDDELRAAVDHMVAGSQ